jgi:hypothetical protein
MANSDFLVKVAEVLEQVAAQIDSVETEKTASALNARKTVVSDLSKKYAEATGDELSKEVQEKLANVDGDIVSFVNKLIEKQAAPVDSLGNPSTQTDNVIPTNSKEAAAKAEDDFMSWILS